MKRLILFLISATLFSCQQKPKQEISENKVPSTKTEKAASLEAVKPKQQTTERNCGFNNLTNTLGKGLVLVSIENEQSRLVIYEDSLLQHKYVSWNYSGEPAKPVCSKYYKPDYGFLHFVYLKETVKSYQVINGFNEIKYLPKEKTNEVISWDKYLLKSYGIAKYYDGNIGKRLEQPFRESPSEEAAIANIPKDAEMLCPMEIKGDWVKVQYDCFYNQKQNKYEGQPCHDFIEKCKPAQMGWIKWRDKNKILIDIFLMP